MVKIQVEIGGRLGSRLACPQIPLGCLFQQLKAFQMSIALLEEHCPHQSPVTYPACLTITSQDSTGLALSIDRPKFKVTHAQKLAKLSRQVRVLRRNNHRIVRI